MILPSCRNEERILRKIQIPSQYSTQVPFRLLKRRGFQFVLFEAYMRTDTGGARGWTDHDAYTGTDEKRNIGSS